MSKILKALVWGDEVSLSVLDTTALVNEAVSRHKLSAVTAAALGRSMTAAAYLCSWLKEEQGTLSVSIDGGGVGGKIGIVGDGNLNMRGYIEHPETELPLRADGKLDVGACVGKEGTISVTYMGDDGLPFTGTSELVSGEIAEDFSAYFLTSEQRPTAIALGVQMQKGKCIGAGGVFLQLLPNASEGAFDRAERAIAQFSNISARMREEGAEKIMRSLGAENWTERAIQFCCRCSRERAASAVLSLGREDAEEVLREEGEIKVHCHYCNTDYRFCREDIAKIFGEDKS